MGYIILIPYKKFIILPLIFLAVLFSIHAQTQLNLIPNGSFEMGNEGVGSSYSYSSNSTPPGYYSITNRASSLYGDFKDPVGGDHTDGGYGMYMVVNSDGLKGEKAWHTEVQVEPNSEYEFTVFFCNLFRLLPPKTDFAFENGDVKGNDPQIKVTVGTDVILIERDYFHMFKWLKGSATWYSGEHNGVVQISIENLNASAKGNDLALDDLSFVFVRTMPVGYIHASRNSTIMHRDYTKPVLPQRKVPLSEYGIELVKNDSLNGGVYTINYKKTIPVVLVQVDTVKPVAIERVVLKNLLFAQSKADLLPQAKLELDFIAEWMIRESDVRVRFIGHTDNQGDSLLNVKLSEQRVEQVKVYLMSKGLAADRIETLGYGGAFPIADNTWEETRKLNRRVEMEILKK